MADPALEYIQGQIEQAQKKLQSLKQEYQRLLEQFDNPSTSAAERRALSQRMAELTNDAGTGELDRAEREVSNLQTAYNNLQRTQVTAEARAQAQGAGTSTATLTPEERAYKEAQTEQARASAEATRAGIQQAQEELGLSRERLELDRLEAERDKFIDLLKDETDRIGQKIAAGHYSMQDATNAFNAALSSIMQETPRIGGFLAGFQPGGPVERIRSVSGQPFDASQFQLSGPTPFDRALQGAQQMAGLAQSFNAFDDAWLATPEDMNARLGYASSTAAPGSTSGGTTGSGGTGSQQLPPVQLPQSPYVEMARQAAIRYGIDPEIFVRQIYQESGFAEDVITGKRKSSAGATGIAQIMPEYHPGVDPLDPVASLDYAARLMRSHLDQYGNYRDALVAYNGGHGAVQAWRSGRPYRESVQYVSAILGDADAPAPPAPRNQPVPSFDAPSGPPSVSSRTSTPPPASPAAPAAPAVAAPVSTYDPFTSAMVYDPSLEPPFVYNPADYP